MTGRPVTLFTGQWADLPLSRVCELASDWGYDGLELASWGDHLDVRRVLDDGSYAEERLALLDRHGLAVHAISNHLVGQAVCDAVIDERHRAILPDRVWGDGDPEAVRKRAATEMEVTARAAARLGVQVVTGFTGSAIWHLIAMFPPVGEARIEAGFGDFAERWGPVLDVFQAEGVRFALEVHPGEIAYDYWTTERALAAVDRHPAFGLNFDPSHLIWQDIDPASFIWDFRDRIFHVHVKDTKRHLDGRSGRLASHLPWGDPRRGWDFVSPGRGDVQWERCVRVLNAIGYRGPLSVEWEDAGMERVAGAAEAQLFTRALAELRPAERGFDAAFGETIPTGEDDADCEDDAD